MPVSASVYVMLETESLAKPINERREWSGLNHTSYKAHITAVEVAIVPNIPDDVRSDVKTFITTLADKIYREQPGELIPEYGKFRTWISSTSEHYYVKRFIPCDKWCETITPYRTDIYKGIAKKLGYDPESFNYVFDGDYVMFSYIHEETKTRDYVLRVPSYSFGVNNVQYHATVMSTTYDKEKYCGGTTFQNNISKGIKKGTIKPSRFQKFCKPEVRTVVRFYN